MKYISFTNFSLLDIEETFFKANNQNNLKLNFSLRRVKVRFRSQAKRFRLLVS